MTKIERYVLAMYVDCVILDPIWMYLPLLKICFCGLIDVSLEVALIMALLVVTENDPPVESDEWRYTIGYESSGISDIGKHGTP